jgi:hypothetical protein
MSKIWHQQFMLARKLVPMTSFANVYLPVWQKAQSFHIIAVKSFITLGLVRKIFPGVPVERVLGPFDVLPQVRMTCPHFFAVS